MPLLDAVREAEEAWNALRLVRTERGKVIQTEQAVAQLCAGATSAVHESSRFTRVADTTLDTRTGLMWSDTLGKKVKYDGSEKAIANCRVGGFMDWRKPTVDELQTILDHSCYAPAIDRIAFPNTKSDWYWTATECAWDDKEDDGKASSFWLVCFLYGFVDLVPRGNLAFARAVRGGGAPARQ